ncbi:unnamed protein product [Orchesella dallaii]|uniref:Uncharacterized protein n=1 Tax=Orchesella dallaii TaxID=48710 RepID=A0ABP1QTK0_9HEXA
MKVHGPDELWLQHQDKIKSSAASALPDSHPHSKLIYRRRSSSSDNETDCDSDSDIIASSSRCLWNQSRRRGQSSAAWRFSKCQMTLTAQLPQSPSLSLSVPFILVVTFVTLQLVTCSVEASSLGIGEETVTNNVSSRLSSGAPGKKEEEKEEVKTQYESQHSHHHDLKNSHDDHDQSHHQGRNYYSESTTSSREDESPSHSFPFPIYYAAYIANAVESGVREANNLYETIEPDLYKKDLVIKYDHPAFYLAAINRQSPKAKELAKYAYATLKATSVLKEQLAQLRDERDHPISEISLSSTLLQRSMCPTSRQMEDHCPPWSLRYRKVDGSCNNVRQTHMGSSFQPFGRYLPPEYDDGVSTIRKSVTGKPLPSARKISTTIHRDVSNPSSTFTLMVMQ